MKYITFFMMLAFGEFGTLAWENNGPRCPPLLFPNGRVRMRSRGKIVRFSCFEGYTLVGNRYSTCIRGRWDTPTPVCVNSQCPPPPQPEHSLMATKYNGAVSIYFCEPGYILVGAAEIFCNGRKWNGTAPYCRDSDAAAPTSCDFEKGDLCWWEQDPTHDFDWQRHNHDTPSSHIGTGPSHDHTLGPGFDGYYLYVEASGRLVNDTARIVSPLYNASLAESGCFSFWYHMYGATIGALKVYFKPERSSSQMMFEKEGNQGNQWFHGQFKLPTTNTSFQIIIEGIRGSSYVSDIAVDDVAILQGDECSLTATSIAPETIPTNQDQIELINSLQSCRGRCGSGTPSPDALPTILPPSSPDACQCNPDCAQTSICCPDFAEYCILGVTDWSMNFSVQTVTPVSSNITREPTIAKKPISISPKDDIDPYAKATDISETTTKTTTTTPATTAIRTTKATIKTTIKNGGKTSARTTQTTTPRTTTRQDISSIARETPFPGVTRTWQDPRVSARTEAHVRTEQVTTPQLGVNAITGIVIVIATAIVLTTIITYVILRKRKSYKRGGGGNSSALSEDSDVRFLTNDEILDFNLARPSEYDEL